MCDRELEDRIVGKLISYFDKRFTLIEKVLEQHSLLLTSINSNTRKTVDSRENQKENAFKEKNHEKFFNTPIEFGKGNNILTRTINETDTAPKLTEIQLNGKSPKFIKKDINATDLASSKTSLMKTKPDQSPNVTKKIYKKDESSTKKRELKKRDIKLDDSIFNTTEDYSINSVFSPNHHIGEVKQLIIEPIDVLFQESPSELLEDKLKRPSTTTHSQKWGHILQSDYTTKERNSPYPFISLKISDYRQLISLRGACLLLLGTFMCGPIPPFAICS